MPSTFRSDTYTPICKRSTFGSYIDDNNILRLAQPYQIRPTFNNKVLSGYMNETSSHNYASDSTMHSDSANKGNINSTSVTNILGPDNTYNDVNSLPTNTSGFLNCNSTSQNLSYVESQLWIASVYVKIDTSNSGTVNCWTSWGCNGQWPRFSFSTNRTITGNDYKGGIQTLNSNWMRVWWSTSSNICYQDNNVWFLFGNGTANTVYLSHVQVESVPLSSGITAPSSWIPYSSDRDSDF